ncbi:MAG TPA: DUF3667 domain-containing protein [Parvularculaceae bacterium]|nr:DUF3667 domain-containing protein [Caulobacterales bacterium]HOP20262.1 DUF3667 domain-containing protein [Amphiplicatus sp.]HPE32879.1 DUF3667 domain-containing protein [Parvularculaceae bacterium]HRX40107.1 DUF3667 domain-containing protein [Parvularculaceae bacterium]
MDPDIIDGDIGEVEEPDTDDAIGESEAGAASAAAVEAPCLSCGAIITGVYCAACGQRDDDLRRSSFVLFRDFMRDTFGFDSRMWRTLGLLAAAPGLVPSNYAHGRRSRYTPPVRLFLVISFLFFLTVGLTQTLFVAFEVTRKTEEQIKREELALERMKAESPDAFVDDDAIVTVDSGDMKCNLNTGLRFFVRAQDVRIDEAAWRECEDKILASARVSLDVGNADADSAAAQNVFERVLGGISAAVRNPVEFNNRVNAWLPRLMLMMTPVLALLIGIFIRGRGALLFDHLVLSLYSHAVGFVIVGAAIVAGQYRVPHVGMAAILAIALYFIVALKRAYGRGWIKTVIAAFFIFAFYLTILSSAAMLVVSRVVWQAA